MPKTNRPIVRIHNSETNEIIDREMTDQEFTQYQIEQSERQLKIDEKLAKEAQKVLVLERLGITEDEAKLLLS